MIGATLHHVLIDTRELDSKIESSAGDVLHEMGARIVETVDRSLIYKRGSSRPGKPPHVHRNRFGGASPLKNIEFAMVNPLHMVAGVVGKKGIGSTPRDIEEGSTSTTKNGKRIRIEPRPYMRPGFEIETMRVPGNFADIL